MNNVKFFIDTGDVNYISNIWKTFLSTKLNGKEVVGITTNPNAMSKCNIHTMLDFENKTRELCKIVSSIRNDNKGVVYVQHPNSNITQLQLKKWIDMILKFSDGQTKVGLKIPPYVPLLQLIKDYKETIDFNVTGVADCSTALLSFTYLPRYVSLIPGRMEEQGIDSMLHMKYIDQRFNKENSELITGSMRTIEGLKSAIHCNTIPTIGTKVFDLLISKNIDEFVNLWNFQNNNDYIKFSPLIDQKSHTLSVQFFNQMDTMGEKLNQELNCYE